MKVLDADKGKLVVEMTSEDWRQIGCLFIIIGEMENPNWWMTENGKSEPELDEEKFEKLSDAWDSLTKGPIGETFFIGK